MTRNITRVLPILWAALTTIGCGLSADDTTASPVPVTDTLTAATASPLPVTETPTALPTATPTPTAATALADGWLVFAAARADAADPSTPTPWTIWGVRADGSGLTQLSEARLHEGTESPPEFAVSPDGQQLAMLTAADAYHDLALTILSLPDLQTTSITPLIAPENEPPPHEPGDLDDPRYEIINAVTLAGPVWSPDGQWIAFTGALDGASADLYVYSVQSSAITRLSDEPLQAYSPFWSLDSQTIIFGEFEFTVRMAMVDPTPVPPDVGVYLAAVDGSGVRRLYDAPISYGEVVVGWTSPTTFAVYQSIYNGGPAHLRVVNVETGDVVELTPVEVPGRDVDPASGALVYSTGGYFAGEPVETGTFLLRRGAQAPEPLTASLSRVVKWLPELGWFVAQVGSGGTITVTPDGEVETVDAPLWWTSALLSPDGQTMAWYGIASYEQGARQGLWIGALGSPPVRVSEHDVINAVWSPDCQSLFYTTRDNELYRVAMSDLTPERIAQEVVVERWSEPVWLGR